MSAKQLWIWALIVPVFTLFGETMCIWHAPRFLGSVSLALQAFVVTLVGISVLVAFLVSIYFAISSLFVWRDKSEFYRRLSKALACIFFVGFSVIAVVSSESLRQQAFVRASTIGDPVVRSLARYKSDKGEYPSSVDELIPHYLEAMPYTGMIGYPEFTYTKDNQYNRPAPGTYELRIFCPSGMINFDEFIYHPSEKYPDLIDGNGVQKIGRWAYIHE